MVVDMLLGVVVGCCVVAFTRFVTMVMLPYNHHGANPQLLREKTLRAKMDQ